MLVVGGRRDRIAVVAVGQQVDARTVAQALVVVGGIGLPIAVRQGQLAQAVVDLASGDEAPRRRADRDPLAVAGAATIRTARY